MSCISLYKKYRSIWDKLIEKVSNRLMPIYRPTRDNVKFNLKLAPTNLTKDKKNRYFKEDVYFHCDLVCFPVFFNDGVSPL